MKATHKGSCQACGSGQRLPNGKLSNHGYSVKWNMFSGICQGSKELPFEQSTDLIETFISRAEASICGLKSEITELENYEGNIGWHRAYHNGDYSWAKLDISNTAFNTSMFRDQNNKLCYFSTYSYYGDTLSAVVKRMNQTRIDFYLRQIREFEKYIEWQHLRIKNWKPQPLVEI